MCTTIYLVVYIRIWARSSAWTERLPSKSFVESRKSWDRSPPGPLCNGNLCNKRSQDAGNARMEEFSIDFYKNMSVMCLQGMAYKKRAPDANNLNIVLIGEF